MGVSIKAEIQQTDFTFNKRNAKPFRHKTQNKVQFPSVVPSRASENMSKHVIFAHFHTSFFGIAHRDHRSFARSVYQEAVKVGFDTENNIFIIHQSAGENPRDGTARFDESTSGRFSRLRGKLSN